MPQWEAPPIHNYNQQQAAHGNKYHNNRSKQGANAATLTATETNSRHAGRHQHQQGPVRTLSPPWCWAYIAMTCPTGVSGASKGSTWVTATGEGATWMTTSTATKAPFAQLIIAVDVRAQIVQCSEQAAPAHSPRGRCTAGTHANRVAHQAAPPANRQPIIAARPPARRLR
jgi:hypothetical protein